MRKIFFTLVTIIFTMVTYREAMAISAWARKNDMACGGCHVTGGYRLNREGIAFLRRGHRFPDEAPTLKSQKFGDYMSFNAKMRFNDSNDAVSDDNKVGDTTFEFHALALYMGGSFDKYFSFFSEIYLHERQSTIANVKSENFNDGGRSKLAESYLQFTTTGDNYITARVGQIASQLWMIQGAGGRVSETRNYLVNKTSITTNNGISNQWKPRQRNYGMEVGGTFSGLFAAAGVINGVGNSPTNVTDGSGESEKDFYFNVDYTLMDMVMVGGYAYFGTLESNTFTGGTGNDEFSRYGITLNANFKEMVWVLGSVLMGSDVDTDQLAGSSDTVDSFGYAVELNVPLKIFNGINAFAKYDYFTHNSGATDAQDKDTNVSVINLGVSFGLFNGTNSRIVFEWAQKTTEVKAASTTTTKDQDFRIELSYMI